MRHFRGSLLIASLLASAPLLAVTAPPAQAQFSASISFDSFHNTLSRDGDWLYSDRWGEVWRPMSQDRDRDWRPYWAGRWAPTREYGWTWISDEGDWGDITYHYGRWVYDPDDGWLWLPGYVWSPAWVVWRSSGPDVGWMPMPPDDGFLRPGFSISIGFGDWNDIGGYYGYSRWYGSSFDRSRFGRLWTFVPGDRLADPGYRRYALARPQTVNIIQNSRNITNYTVVNNVIINRSVNDVAGRGGRAPQPVPANTVLRNTRLVTPVNQGEQIQNRARQERPHGDGRINSAPPPTPEQIRTLSTRPVPVPASRDSNAASPGNNGAGNDRGGQRHIFSQANAQELQNRARGGQPNAAPSAAPPPNAPQPGATPQNAPGNAAPDRNRDNGRDNGRDTGGRDTNGRGNSERGGPDNNPRNDNQRGPERPLPGTLPSNPPANVPRANPSEANPSGAERPQAMPPARPALPDNPSTETRGRQADRPPRDLPGLQPAAPPPVTNPPERAAPPREMPAPPREQPQREQPQREQPQRGQPPRAMEQRMPTPERAAPPPERAAPPPERAAQPPERAAPREAPREQARPQGPPREQAPPAEQARPNNPPPDRGQDRGRGNGRDRPDENR
jgi:hypothetical protein